MCSRPKTVLNGASSFYAAMQPGTFWEDHGGDVCKVTESERILVAVYVQCLVWERIYSECSKLQIY